MFLSTIAAAERLAPVGVSAAAKSEMESASEKQITKTTKNFRTILCASMQSFALSLGKYKGEPKCGLCATSNSVSESQAANWGPENAIQPRGCRRESAQLQY